MLRKHPKIRLIVIIFASLCGLAIIGAYPAFLLGKVICHHYFGSWGKKLVDMENRGLLSKSYGAGWQDVLTEQAMSDAAAFITHGNEKVSREESKKSTVEKVDGIILEDYPSLSIINRLRQVNSYSNTIDIVDRLDRPITNIRTDHHRASINEFPPTLINALIAAEDKNFRENNHGYEYGSFVRAALRAALNSVVSMRKVSPKGTSSITQQVAKLFISRLDEQGFRRVSHSMDRKIRELRIASALRQMFTPDDILEVYCNHCVTSDYGMVGYADIADGLFGKKLNELNDAECIYLSRMVKWGRNVSKKIINQCHIDMPRIGDALGWDIAKQKAVLEEIDKIYFQRPKRVQGNHNSLVDLANEYWVVLLKKMGAPPSRIEQMNLIDPNSLIRKKGNLRIKLSIDIGLQQKVEQLVDTRGFGPDTMIVDEVRIGSSGKDVLMESQPRDTMRILRILREPIDFHEPNSAYITSLNQGDTVYTNIRYKKLKKKLYRRSVFHYVRKPVIADGQYFAYSLMNSRTGKLLAYYSKDRIGSRLACLMRNRTPNGSSTVKPICNALNFDLGIFKANSRWTDTLPVYEEVPWKRDFHFERGKKTGVLFSLSSLRNVGYPVHNHGDIFEGCNYIFEHLSSSNNILGTETLYRLNRKLFTPEGEITPEGFPVVQLFSRIGAFSHIKDSLKMSSVTGVRVYKEICRIVGVDTDSLISLGKKVPLSDSMFSVALGTLEMTLYEQMHLFNVLYNNDIIESPASKPSLIIESITLNGDTVIVNDTIRRYHPFSDINSIRPTLLGLHKRLISNPADGLAQYDIAMPTSSYTGADSVFFTNPAPDTVFDPDKFTIDSPLSNFAKSGTTDDVIRPYNVDATSKQRTNYGIWNAVIRIDLSRFSSTSRPVDIQDVTIACIGECNRKYTGERDGKTLHKYLSKGLLKEGGIKAVNGYFAQYENYIRSVPSDDRYCSMPELAIDDTVSTQSTSSSKSTAPQKSESDIIIDGF